METGSCLLLGTGEKAGALYTTAHGRGRTIGRRATNGTFAPQEVVSRMRDRGIYVKGACKLGLVGKPGECTRILGK